MKTSIPITRILLIMSSFFILAPLVFWFFIIRLSIPTSYEKKITVDNESSHPLTAIMLSRINVDWQICKESNHTSRVLNISEFDQETFRFGREGIPEFKIVIRTRGKLLEQDLDGNQRIDTVRVAEMIPYKNEFNSISYNLFSFDFISAAIYFIILYFIFRKFISYSRLLRVILLSVHIIGVYVAFLLMYERVRLIFFFI